MTEQDLPEAPASVTYSIISPNGYPALFTLRETTGQELLKKMTALEKVLGEEGYKPQARQGFAKKEIEYVAGKVCPLDGGRLVKKFTKAGKEYHKCENGKFFNGVASGCTYVDWMNPVQVPGKTMTVEEYEKSQFPNEFNG